jgi:type I restriction enzyme, S subunit
MTEKQTVKFGDICREVKLTTKNPIADGYDKYIGLEHLDSGSLKIKRWGIIAEDNPSFNRVFKKGHILFGKRRSYLKKAAIAEFDGVCSGDIIVMEPNGDLILPELLQFIVQSDGFWNWAIKTSSGSLSPRTKFSSLASYKLGIPFLNEQCSLLDILLKNKDVHEISHATLDSLSRARFTLVENIIKRTSSFSKIKLDTLITIKNGFAYPGEHIVDEETDLIIVTPGNFALGGGYFKEKNRFYTGEPIRDFVLSNGALIVNMTDLSKAGDTLGLPAFIPHDPDRIYLHNQRVGLINIKSNRILPEFLFIYMCSSDFRRKVVATSTGTTVRHTSVKKLLDFELGIPPEHFQLTAIKALKSINIIKSVLEARSTLFRKLINNLLREI